MDNRRRNKAIKRMRYPGKLDFNKAFHQFELEEEQRNMAVITTHEEAFLIQAAPHGNLVRVGDFLRTNTEDDEKYSELNQHDGRLDGVR